MSLGIEQVTITDALTERAKTCTTVLAPLDRIGAPTAEFRLAGDTQQLSGSVYRPNGGMLDVHAAYGNVPSHSIFHGAIEVMDDLENADAYNYTIVLSAIPANQGHRTRISQLYDLATFASQVTANTTTHAILRSACAAVGIPFGRCDLPNVAVYGSYEVIHQNICEIAEAFCQPFNQFEYFHYFVRVSERDGLSIIGIDYTKGGGVANFYEVANVESKTRTFQRYMPDNRLGGCDILLVGADQYRDNDNSGGMTIIYPVTRNWHSDSRTEDAEVGTIEWTETDTFIEYLLAVTIPPSNPTPGDYTSLEAAQAALSAGEVESVVVLSSKTLHTRQCSYTNDEGLVAEVDTWYTYQTKFFATQVYKFGDRGAEVVTRQETLTTQYLDGSSYPETLVKVFFTYGKTGAQSATTTETYYNDGRGAWVLQTVQTESSEGANVTSADIQNDADPDLDWAVKYALPLATNHGPRPATVIGKYQLLNGSPLVIHLAPKPGVYDPTGALLDEEQREKRCFRISCPYMDYAGLRLIWAMCAHQRALEHAGAYWELVKATASIDTSPAAGESIVVRGSSGICDSVEHVITEDAAMTTLSIRRLVTGGEHV